jgi:cobalt-zinc-cadmium efflux system membrane fusion protein
MSGANSMLLRLSAIGGCLLALTAAGCSDKVSEAATPVPVVKDNLVIFSDSSPQLKSFEAKPVQPVKPPVHRFTGRLVWNEDRTVRVFSPFAGSVVGIEVRPGDQVVAGKTLAIIASPDFGQAQAEASRAAADFAIAKKNADRLRDLVEHGVAPDKDLQAAEADLQRASAELERATLRRKLYGGGDGVDQRYLLRAPVGGVVVEKNINPGQEVRPDQMTSNAPPLFVITEPRRLWVLLDATEQDLVFLHLGMTVALKTPAYADRTFAAHIEAISDFVDPSTRMIRVRGAVENADHALKGEMFVTGEVEGEPGEGVLVPSTAVFLVGDRYFVFVRDGNARFIRTEIARSGEVDGKIIVRRGLTAGQPVVTGGALLLEQMIENGSGG